ncbi:MAG: MATE family efflux transporter, partial [Oscillospiraceae bacterium]|nr:MATE family efflux transporter [Oscillospiraceae bacterium]
MNKDFSKGAVWKITLSQGVPLITITRDICKLGTSNFVMQGTNCFVQIACNSTLQTCGGDIYVGIMT